MQQHILLIVLVTSLVFGVSLVLSIYFIKYIVFNTEIIAAKDEENKIEGFIRSLLFKVICNNEEYINNIIFTDLNSKDETGKIMENLTNEYKEVRFLKWKNCKELIEDIDRS